DAGVDDVWQRLEERVRLRRTHALQMAPDVALQEDRCGKARGMAVQGDVTVGGRIDGLVAEVDVAGQLGSGLELVLEPGLEHLLDRLVVKRDPVTADLDGDGKTVDFLANLMVRRCGRLHSVADQDELETLRLTGQLIRHLRHGIFRIDVADAVDVRLLDYGCRSRIRTAGRCLGVVNGEVEITAVVDVGNGMWFGVTTWPGLDCLYL